MIGGLRKKEYWWRLSLAEVIEGSRILFYMWWLSAVEIQPQIDFEIDVTSTTD